MQAGGLPFLGATRWALEGLGEFRTILIVTQCWKVECLLVLLDGYKLSFTVLHFGEG